MEDEFEHPTESAGQLDPPSRKPPTAVGLAASGSDPEGRKFVRTFAKPNWLGRFLNDAFDLLDYVGDRVADELKLRPPRGD